MTQKTQSLLFVCSRCRVRLSKHVLRPSRRTFTNTSPQSRSIPSFTPTSSPELDEIFSTFRQKVFTPYALSQHHRDLIYQKSRHSILLNDPGVTVTLSNDEEIRLMPMEPRERPNKRKSLHRVAQLLGESTEPERWTNLPSFLEGMRMAKEELPKEWWEKIVRKANTTGKTGIIKLCVEMVKKTGASLSIPEMTRELMLGYHLQAVKEGFQGESLEKSLRSAEQVFSMMNDQEHCAGRVSSGRKDMRNDSVVLGVLLELNAYAANNLNNGEDVGGRVTTLVQRILASTEDETWPEQEYEHYGLKGEWIVLWNGMRTALSINSINQGPQASELRSTAAKLEEAIRRVQRTVTAETSSTQFPTHDTTTPTAVANEAPNAPKTPQDEEGAVTEDMAPKPQVLEDEKPSPAPRETKARGRRFLQMLEDVDAVNAR